MTPNVLVIGCNYHTKWQNHPAMRFVLESVKDGSAILSTRTTRKRFSTSLSDLIFIESKHNIEKAKRLYGPYYKKAKNQ